MIDTTDLTSYIPGYDDYCEPKQEIEYYDDSDVVHDEMMIRREIEKMNRKAIDLNNTNMTFEEVLNLDEETVKNLVLELKKDSQSSVE